MKLKYILPIAAVILLIFGVVLMAITLTSSDEEFVKNITLNDKEVTKENIEFSANGLNPGETKQYTINLAGSSSGEYAFTLDFVEQQDGALKDYVDVTVWYGEESQTFKLSELLNGRSINFRYTFDTHGKAVIKIAYSIPIEIGNEAQNVTSDFTVTITVKNI